MAKKQEDKEISLTEFYVQMTSDLAHFYKHWQEEIKKGNPHYPKKLLMGDWFEQFMAHQTT